MPKLELRGIANQVRDLLQNDIEEGRLAPGARIHEEAIARKLGISKTPVRLAIHELKQTGIIDVRPRQGIYVRVPRMKEVMELLEMREALEGVAARRAAHGADENVVRQLRNCFAGFGDENVNGHPVKYATADHRFHQTLAQASGSDELIKNLQMINFRLHMNRLRRTAVRQTDQRPIHREHLAIIDAIGRGDGDLAAKLASEHVRGVPWASILAESGIASAEADARLGMPS